MNTQPVELFKAEIEEQFEQGDFDSEYAEYIIAHSCGDRVICNGNTLIIAMEDGYLREEFINHLIYKTNFVDSLCKVVK